jgi:hypothetical protein
MELRWGTILTITVYISTALSNCQYTNVHRLDIAPALVHMVVDGEFSLKSFGLQRRDGVPLMCLSILILHFNFAMYPLIFCSLGTGKLKICGGGDSNGNTALAGAAEL